MKINDISTFFESVIDSLERRVLQHVDKLAQLGQLIDVLCEFSVKS